MGADAVALHAEALTKRYGTLTAVDGLSLSVPHGTLLGFLGPNGAGKSTSLRMMCGLLAPDAGTVTLCGRPLRPHDREIAGLIGVAPQEIVTWDGLTSLEQLEFAGRIQDLSAAAARARARELVAQFGLAEKADKLGGTLSGGMQRRLHIALALVHRPRLLFLDEPQAGLDPQSRVLVRDVVRALRGTCTVIITTHDMEEAEKICDSVCIVDRGRKLAEGTVDAIKRRLGEGDLHEVTLRQERAAELAAFIRTLEAAPEVAVPTPRTLSFATTDGTSLLPALLQETARLGLRVDELRVRKATLEDVFIRLTGRGLRE